MADEQIAENNAVTEEEVVVDKKQAKEQAKLEKQQAKEQANNTFSYLSMRRRGYGSERFSNEIRKISRLNLPAEVLLGENGL